MADADRDSDLGDDSPGASRRGKICLNFSHTQSARSEGESSGEHSCESSDEGAGRDVPVHTNHNTHSPIAHLTQAHQIQPPQMQHAMNHHANHPVLNNHPLNHNPRNSPRPHERELKVREDFEALKSSLHPHLSSLASLAQGAPLSTPNSVFALAAGSQAGGFPYAPPAFLAPAPPPPAQPAGSASSSSSEGSGAGWSFEEQYKQVRQLYEISDDPQRKEFLDDLFSFMQKRGTPINRLPIMAKSVLDLYELYNLVIARGGLVEVINKKLWQEIIKGLKLPSSITSAAFTLRTQYMKYLYDYECEKKNLSTRSELDAAIEGNKREGRRSSGQYDPRAEALASMPNLSRTMSASLAQLGQHIPLPLSLGVGIAGVARLPLTNQGPHMSPHDIDYRFRDYVHRMMNQQQQRENGRHDPESPPRPSNGNSPIISNRDGASISAIDVQRLALWSIYGNNSNSSQPPDVEPQREALNLSESPNSSNSARRESNSPPPAKRRALSRSPSSPVAGPSSPARSSTRTPVNGISNGVNGAAFKITTRGDTSTGDQQLVVSIEINGVTYEGILFPSQDESEQNGRSEVVS